MLRTGLGSVRVTIDQTGEIVSYDDYDPWGMQLEGRSDNLADGNDKLKFTSKERDFETGYDYFGARYYDSRVGKWWQIDPMSEKHPGLSPYNYTNNNPVLLIDPKGLDWYKDENGNVQWFDSKEKSYSSNDKNWNNIGSSYTYQQSNWSYTFNQKDLVKAEVNVMKPDQWVSQFSLSNPDGACNRADRKMLAEFGLTPAGGSFKGGNGDIHTSGNNPDLQAGINAIESSLYKGLPIMAGEDYKPGHTGNADKVTDHFDIIMGAQYDLIAGTTQYRFYNPGTHFENVGTSPNNLFTVTSGGINRLTADKKSSHISTVRLNSNIR